MHGIRIYSEEHARLIKLITWGGRLVRAVEIYSVTDDHDCLTFFSSNVAKAPDWIFDLAPRPASLTDDTPYQKGICVAVTAHNALLQVTVQKNTDTATADRCASLTLSSLNRDTFTDILFSDRSQSISQA